MTPTLLSLLVLLGCPEIPDDEPVDTSSDDTGDPPADADEDGYPVGEDCDDGDASVHPGVDADGCDGVDSDCDGTIDEDPDLSWYPDGDGDGYGGAGDAQLACARPEGLGPGSSDCDDANPDTWPGADERCDEADNDCDGEADEGLALDVPYWVDGDGDGAGDPASVAFACAMPSTPGLVANGWDCDDDNGKTPAWVAHGAGVGSGTVDDPFRRIGDALADGRSCVIVGPGTYNEDLDWPEDDVWVRAVDGPDDTTISGSGTRPVVTVAQGSTTGSRLDGFTLTGGGGVKVESTQVSGGTTYHYTRHYGGGVAVGRGSALTLDTVVLRDNTLPELADTSAGSVRYVTQSYGGGAYVQGGTLELVDVRVKDNYAYNGGAFFVTEGALRATTSVVAGNSAYTWASLYADSGSEIDLSACIVNANVPTSSPGGLAVYDSVLRLAHTNVLSHDYGVYARGSELELYASILEGNAYGVQASASSFSASYSAAHNSSADYVGVTDPSGSDGNLDASCAFTDYRDDVVPDNDDLTLGAGSPCIDAARSSELDPDGSRADIGAYGGPYAFAP